METIKRLLSPEYLAVAEPGPLEGAWVLYLALGLLFAAGLALALRVLLRRGRPATPHAAALAWLELWVCLAGLGAVVGRFAGWPGWSARIWPYSLAVLALLGAAAYRRRDARLPAWLAPHIAVLAGRGTGARPEMSSSFPNFLRSHFPTSLLPLALHLLGAGLVLAARYGWPVWTAPLVLAALASPQAARLLRGRPPVWAALSPLFGAYAATLLWLAYRRLGITVVGWQGLAFPNPMLSLFYVDGIVLAVVAWFLLCQISAAVPPQRRAAAGRWLAAGLLLVTLAWAGTVYLAKRTHGATASDPYAYAQMGVDLAERGSFLHRFDLFQEVIPLEIAWAPLQPVGYHIPRNSLGDCPSVWATGASALLAAGYLLLGETGLYVTTPVVGLLALAATWALAHEVLRGQGAAARHLTAALAVALLATSPEYVDRLLVPMADSAALLFTTMFLFCLLRAQRAPGWPWWLLAGASFALAYWVRHTQIVLGIVALAAVWGAGKQGSGKRGSGNQGSGKQERSEPDPPILDSPIPRSLIPDSPLPAPPISRSLLPLLLFSAAALVTALPDIVYRWRVFGGLLATETTELPLMGVQHVGPVAAEMVRAALAGGEWGYLFPLALYGAWRLGRERRRAALLLGLAFAAVLLVHLTYRSLRLRDLISLFGLLDLAVAYGAVSLVRSAWRAAAGQRERLGPALLPVLAVAWIVLSLGLGRWAMVDNLWKRGWASFGYMRPEHRAAFERLAALTPSEAVIGASLNAGAVALYTGRDPIRPYDSWTEAEWEIFLEAMQARGRPVYLLDDGRLMADFIARESSRHRLVPVAMLGVPIFGAEGREAGWLYRLEGW